MSLFQNIEQAFSEGRIEDAQALIQEYRQKAEADPTLTELVRSQSCYARLLIYQNHLSEASEELNKARQLAQVIKDLDGVALTLREQVRLEYLQGHFDQGRESAQKLLELARSLKNDSFEISTLSMMLAAPNSYQERKRLAHQLQEKLTGTTLCDRQTQNNGLYQLSGQYLRSGEITLCKKVLDQGLKADLNQPIPFAFRLLYLCCQMQQGAIQQALAGFTQLEQELGRQNATRQIEILQIDYSSCLYHSGELSPSFFLYSSLLSLSPMHRHLILFSLLEGYSESGFFLKALDILHQFDPEITPNHTLFIDYSLRKARLLLQMGALSPAEEILQTLKKQKNTFDPEQEYRFCLAWACLYQSQLNYSQAIALLRKLVGHIKKSGAFLLYFQSLLLLGTLYSDTEELHEAESLIQELNFLQKRFDSKLYTLQALTLNGLIHAKQKKLDSTVALWQSARLLARGIGHVRLEWEIDSSLGEIYFQKEDWTHSQFFLMEALELLYQASRELDKDFFFSFWNRPQVKTLFHLLSQLNQKSWSQTSGLRPRGIEIRNQVERDQHKSFAEPEVVSEPSSIPANNNPLPIVFDPFPAIVGRSSAILELKRTMVKVKDSALTLLLQGETGVGKDLVAKTLHENSLRTKDPFFAINCGAIPEPLLESELFGHLQGAFTGAHKEKKGLFLLATGGTLFLDEVGELPHSAQAKLLRAIEDHQILPLGGNRYYSVDVRIIAATNRDLRKEVEQKTFRQDLFYRMSVFTLTLSPLRERKEDIGLLIDTFLDELSKKQEGSLIPQENNPKYVTPQALQILLNYPWPGNVRELLNTIKALHILASGETIEEALVQQYFTEQKGFSDWEENSRKNRTPKRLPTLSEAKEIAEREALRQTLEAVHYDTLQAAKLLGITRQHVYGLIKKYALSKKGNNPPPS